LSDQKLNSKTERSVNKKVVDKIEQIKNNSNTNSTKALTSRVSENNKSKYRSETKDTNNKEKENEKPKDNNRNVY